jgi:hypothetical protein
MPYGDDITEGIPYALSNPAGAVNYSATAESYDMAISGQPFFLMINDEFPYRRETAQYRKQQVDQSNEPGEQSITGWWVRAQSSFHSGDGINFYDPSAGETVPYRFADSKGVNVWNKGRVTLLKNVTPGHVTTGPIATNGVVQQHMRSIKWSTYTGALLHDEYDVDKVIPRITVSITNKARTTTVATLTTSAAHGLAVGMVITISGVGSPFDGEFTITTVPTTTTFTYTTPTSGTVASAAVSPAGVGYTEITHFVDYNSGADSPVYAICDDGTFAYWITNTSTKKTVYKKALTSTSADIDTKMFDEIGTVANATMEYVKDRIILCADNKVYEFSTSATAMPSPVYTQTTSSHVYTSITASGPAIYIAGYNGAQSTIQKFTLSTAGAMPSLTSAIVAAEMPVGEIIHKIYYYLGLMMIGTNRGIRVATVSDQDGSIKYGPLIVETTQPCYDFAARDHYVWCATGVGGNPGLIRIDLDQEIETLRFAYANDIYYAGETGHVTTAVCFNGNTDPTSTDRLMFSTAYALAANGAVYTEDASTLISSGYLQTGKIRYSTLENKVFKILKPRIDNATGGFSISSIDRNDTSRPLGTFSQGDLIGEINVSYPASAQEYLSFKFELTRSTTDTTKGPNFDGYQLKSLPSIPRQRIIQYPLACYDREQDSYGVQVGHEGSAYDKLSALEVVENTGDTVRVEDFRTGESYLGLIEQIQFINRTPTDKRFSGFGGILLLTIRSI